MELFSAPSWDVGRSANTLGDNFSWGKKSPKIKGNHKKKRNAQSDAYKEGSGVFKSNVSTPQYVKHTWQSSEKTSTEKHFNSSGNKSIGKKMVKRKQRGESSNGGAFSSHKGNLIQTPKVQQHNAFNDGKSWSEKSTKIKGNQKKKRNAQSDVYKEGSGVFKSNVSTPQYVKHTWQSSEKTSTEKHFNSSGNKSIGKKMVKRKQRGESSNGGAFSSHKGKSNECMINSTYSKTRNLFQTPKVQQHNDFNDGMSDKFKKSKKKKGNLQLSDSQKGIGALRKQSFTSKTAIPEIPTKQHRTMKNFEHTYHNDSFISNNRSRKRSAPHLEPQGDVQAMKKRKVANDYSYQQRNMSVRKHTSNKEHIHMKSNDERSEEFIEISNDDNINNEKIFNKNKGNKLKKLEKVKHSSLPVSKQNMEGNDQNQELKSPYFGKNRFHDTSLSLRERMLLQLKSSRFRYINEQLYISESKDAEYMFKTDPNLFKVYHQGFRQQVEQWPLNPLKNIINNIKRKPTNLVVADFGCGDATLAKSIPNKVHSFDLVALSEEVTVCDMAHTPLKNGSVDICVFCLSLMGTNLSGYLVEANRVLKFGGSLKIAEVASRFDNVQLFIKNMTKYGFTLINKDLSHDLFYFLNFKKELDIKNTKQLPNLSLQPCWYKKR